VSDEPRTHWVYRALDREGRVLYVGCTKQPRKRWSQHKTDRANWVPYVCRWRLSGPYVHETARRIETAEQARLQPYWGQIPGRYNRTHEGAGYPLAPTTTHTSVGRTLTATKGRLR